MLDRLLPVALDERLSRKRHRRDGLVDLAFDDLRGHVARLAILGNLRQRDLAFLRDHVDGHLRLLYGDRLECGDMHRDILAERVGPAAYVDEHADFRAVHVGCEPALRFAPDEAAERDVLALHERQLEPDLAARAAAQAPVRRLLVLGLREGRDTRLDNDREPVHLLVFGTPQRQQTVRIMRGDPVAQKARRKLRSGNCNSGTGSCAT